MTAPPPGPGRVHLWRVGLDRPEADRRALEATLSPDERGRAGRFRDPKIAARFVVGRGALRAILGRYCGVEPGALGFEYGARGKPSLAGISPVGFNLAHSRDLALVAVSGGMRVGVDVEAIRPMPDAAGIVARFFSPAELAEFRAVPESESLAAFFRGWTRKEAFLKATGQGLSLSLDRFDVPLSAAGPDAAMSVVGWPEADSHWALRDVAAGAGFAAALVAEGEVDGVEDFDWP